MYSAVCRDMDGDCATQLRKIVHADGNLISRSKPCEWGGCGKRFLSPTEGRNHHNNSGKEQLVRFHDGFAIRFLGGCWLAVSGRIGCG